MLHFLRSNLDRPVLVALLTEQKATNRDNNCSGDPQPLSGIRLPGPIRLTLYEALKRTAISESCSRSGSCSRLGCSNLSKLKPYFKSKATVRLRVRAAEKLVALAKKGRAGR